MTEAVLNVMGNAVTARGSPTVPMIESALPEVLYTGSTAERFRSCYHLQMGLPLILRDWPKTH